MEYVGLGPKGRSYCESSLNPDVRSTSQRCLFSLFKVCGALCVIFMIERQAINDYSRILSLIELASG